MWCFFLNLKVNYDQTVPKLHDSINKLRWKGRVQCKDYGQYGQKVVFCEIRLLTSLYIKPRHHYYWTFGHFQFFISSFQTSSRHLKFKQSNHTALNILKFPLFSFFSYFCFFLSLSTFERNKWVQPSFLPPFSVIGRNIFNGVTTFVRRAIVINDLSHCILKVGVL